MGTCIAMAARTNEWKKEKKKGRNRERERERYTLLQTSCCLGLAPARKAEARKAMGGKKERKIKTGK